MFLEKKRTSGRRLRWLQRNPSEMEHIFTSKLPKPIVKDRHQSVEQIIVKIIEKFLDFASPFFGRSFWKPRVYPNSFLCASLFLTHVQITSSICLNFTFWSKPLAEISVCALSRMPAKQIMKQSGSRKRRAKYIHSAGNWHGCGHGRPCRFVFFCSGVGKLLLKIIWPNPCQDHFGELF